MIMSIWLFNNCIKSQLMIICRLVEAKSLSYPIFLQIVILTPRIFVCSIYLKRALRRRQQHLTLQVLWILNSLNGLSKKHDATSSLYVTRHII